MKIAVKNLRPNPFRKMKTYPISREKIEALKISIKDTSFWDNILARPHPTNKGVFEIAYGHHRLKVLQTLKIKTVDIPIRDLDDALMIKIMANENLDDWGLRPAILMETVLVTKEFLDAELAKCEKLATSDKSIRGLFDNQRAFETAKGMGVGRETILKFLGGNWTGGMIQGALDTLKRIELPAEDGGLDKKAIDVMPTSRRATAFKDAVRTYKPSKPLQRKIAAEIKDKDIGSPRIMKTVRDAIPKRARLTKDPMVAKLEKMFSEIDQQSAALERKIVGFNLELKELNVSQLKGLRAVFVMASTQKLLQAVWKLYGFFNIKKQKLLKG